MRGLCTFNKYQFMKDLGVNVQYSSTLNLNSKINADLMVDATGTREFLGHLPEDSIYVTYQVKTRFKEPPFNDFYMRFPSDMGHTLYLWFFPTGEKEAFVGCGSLQGVSAAEQVNHFIHKHSGETLEKQAKQLRINPPIQSLPFYKENMVGVGGSVGAISSFGEGNEPSAVTTDLLAENITDLYEYQKQVFKHLKWLKQEYAYYNSLAQNCRLKMLFNILRRHPTTRKRYQVPINPLAFKKPSFS